jgi:hypothetical protein
MCLCNIATYQINTDNRQSIYNNSHKKNTLNKRSFKLLFLLLGEGLTGSTLNMDDCWTINIKAPASLLVEKEHLRVPYSSYSI